jgi:predicted permease
MRWYDAIRTRLGLLLRSRAADARMDEEFRFHIDMEVERLVREEGLDPGEARRRALIAFGGEDRHREALRDGRGLAWLGGLSLDFRLGFRMLVKYPGLTIVGGLAMAFAIWAGAVTFVLVGQFISPSLPLPGGDRIVEIVTRDEARTRVETRVLSDFLVWRDALASVTDLGAWRDAAHNLIVANDAGRPVRAAEISASAFRIAPEPAMLGRVLLPADERVGAPPVVVIGHEIWRTRFGSDADVVGRTVRLGDDYTTVVGVMPEGFAFPVSHELWTPLRPDAIAHGPREGPGIEVFGRLAPGVTLEGAQTELTTIGRRASVEHPDTHEHLEPRIARYTDRESVQSPEEVGLMLSIDGFAVLLLILICSNVALLLFARAATRETELLTRSALGASRGRIVSQLFVEALVLGGVATAVGLGAAEFALRHWGVEFLERNMGPLPFWFDISLSPAAVLYACALTVLGAAVAGMVPARKVVRALGARMRENSAGGGGLRFGGVWTAVIVTQVALTVAFPVIVYVVQREHVRLRSLEVGFPAEEYLAVRLDMDAPIGAGAEADEAREAQGAPFVAAVEVLRRQVARDPAVAGVTFVDRLPGDGHLERRVELDEANEASDAPPAGEATLAWIDPSYFEVLGSPIVAGRGFTAADLVADARTVIVDQGFVDLMMRGRNPIGRRVRIADGRTPVESADDDSRPWYEIVGVVEELGMAAFNLRRRVAGLYLPASPGSAGPAQRAQPISGFPTGPQVMLVHVRSDPLSLVPRVREIATAASATLRLSSFRRADEVTNDVLWVIGLWLRTTVILTGIALLLSLAGIYSVLSFTVARRTREIGVRVALGASRRGIVTSIFRKPLAQVGAGIAAGFVLVTAVAWFMSGHRPDGAPRAPDAGLSVEQVALLVTHALVMLAVCLIACVVPTWRALRVQPTEALRAE